MVLFVSSDMTFGNVDVQLFLKHMEWHKAPRQKPQIGLHVKLVSVQGASFPLDKSL